MQSTEIDSKCINDSAAQRMDAGNGTGESFKTSINTQLRNALRLIEAEESISKLARHLDIPRASLLVPLIRSVTYQ